MIETILWLVVVLGSLEFLLSIVDGSIDETYECNRDTGKTSEKVFTYFVCFLIDVCTGWLTIWRRLF